MRAELDQRVDALASREPEMERDIGVARRRREIVIIALAGGEVAPVGLNRHDQLAKPHDAEAECAVGNFRIGVRRAPGAVQRAPEFERSVRKLGGVFGERKDGLALALRKRGDQVRRCPAVPRVITRGAENVGDRDDARGRIETDRVAGASAARGVIGQHAGEALFRIRLAAEPRPCRREVGCEGDAVGQASMRDRRELRGAVAGARRLERDGARQNAPVDLGQRHMHCKIGGAEAARRGAPGVEPDPGEHHLKHRRAERIERRSVLGVEARRKGGGVEHDVEALAREHGAQERERRFVLEARHIERGRGEAALGKGVGQRLDGLKVGGEKDRAVEDDERAGRAGRSVKTGAVEEAAGRNGFGRRRFAGAVDLAAEGRETGRHVARSAFVEIAPEAIQRLRCERGCLVEPRIGAPVAGQERQLYSPPARKRRQFVNAIAPVIRSPKQARDDELRMGADAFEIKIDRIGVAQGRQTRDAQGRLRLGRGLVGACEGAEVAVGEGEEDDVRGRLAEIYRLDRLVERADLDARDVHSLV